MTTASYLEENADYCETLMEVVDDSLDFIPLLAKEETGKYPPVELWFSILEHLYNSGEEERAPELCWLIPSQEAEEEEQ